MLTFDSRWRTSDLEGIGFPTYMNTKPSLYIQVWFVFLLVLYRLIECYDPRTSDSHSPAQSHKYKSVCEQTHRSTVRRLHFALIKIYVAVWCGNWKYG